MVQRGDSEAAGEVRQAIERVLAAERASEAALEAARAGLRREIDAAAEDAARVRERARQRIAVIRARCDRAIERGRMALDSREDPTLDCDAAAEASAVARIVEVVARELVADGGPA